MKIHGNKSYAVALVMVVIGLYLLLTAPTVTFDNMGAAVEAAVGRLLGWLFIVVGVAVATLRHGIARESHRARAQNAAAWDLLQKQLSKNP